MTTGLAAIVSNTGISAPPFATILSSIQASVQGIYGSDIYVAPDSKDGQLLALFSQAISDVNDAAIGTYGSFAPSTAQGPALSSVVKVNGIARLVSSNSTAPGLVVGQVGYAITNGVVGDANGNQWNLPASVTIPPAGQIAVTVTAANLGAILAPSGTINKILTPSQGWQSFASTSAATPGAPVEADPTLRSRQAVSTSLPAQTPLAALQGALLNLAGVQRVKIYENTTLVTDANGLPGKSICVVIQGGTLAAVSQTIGQKKTPGAATYGTTSQSYVDPVTGIPYTIYFYLLVNSAIKVNVTGSAAVGYTTAQAAAIQVAVAAYINSHNTGEKVEYSGLWAPAYQNGPARLQPYEITAVTINVDGGAFGTTDIVVPFNKIAACAMTDITVTIT